VAPIPPPPPAYRGYCGGRGVGNGLSNTNNNPPGLTGGISSGGSGDDGDGDGGGGGLGTGPPLLGIAMFNGPGVYRGAWSGYIGSGMKVLSRGNDPYHHALEPFEPIEVIAEMPGASKLQVRIRETIEIIKAGTRGKINRVAPIASKYWSLYGIDKFLPMLLPFDLIGPLLRKQLHIQARDGGPPKDNSRPSNEVTKRYQPTALNSHLARWMQMYSG
jgi:hypothetical protein